MSSTGNKKNKCKIKSSNGEIFPVLFDGVKGSGLCFTLQELTSKDYLGSSAGTFSKTPYYWSIVSSDGGMLNGEWEFRFDNDIKSVIAYSHKTFVISLFDADKKCLAVQRVSSSNFGTGLNKSYPDGTRAGGYLERHGCGLEEDGSVAENSEIAGYPEDDYRSYDEIVVSKIVPDTSESDAEVEDGPEENKKKKIEEDCYQGQKDVTNSNLSEINFNENSVTNLKEEKATDDGMRNIYSGVLEDAISHNGGYVKDSGWSLKTELRVIMIIVGTIVVLVLVLLIMNKIF